MKETEEAKMCPKLGQLRDPGKKWNRRKQYNKQKAKNISNKKENYALLKEHQEK